MSDHIMLIALALTTGFSLAALLSDMFLTDKRIKRLEATVANLEALAVEQTNKETAS